MMKVRWNRVVIALIFIMSLSLILYDTYCIAFKPWFTGEMYSWTIFGFLTFIIAFQLSLITFEQLEGWWNNA